MTDRTLPQLVQELCTQPEQEAINYIFHRHLSINHVARHLGISPQALRARLDAARRKLNRAGSGTTDPLELYTLAEWICQRNRRDIAPDQPSPASPAEERRSPSAAEQLDGMLRSGAHGPGGVPIVGYLPGAARIDIGRTTVSSRPDHAIERLIA